jgi:hypothetical protein
MSEEWYKWFAARAQALRAAALELGFCEPDISDKDLEELIKDDAKRMAILGHLPPERLAAEAA